MAKEIMDDEYDDGYVVKEHRRWPFLLLGFFIGFIVFPAVIAAIVVAFINRPLGKTVNTIDRFAKVGLYETLFGDEEDYGILDERYSDMKLKDAIGDIADIASKGSDLTFADLNTISPQVEKAVDNLIKSAKEHSISFNKTTLMNTPLSDLSTVFTDEINEIELGMVMIAQNPDSFEDEDSGKILKNLFFGKKDVNYIEVDGKIEMLPISYTFDEDGSLVCIDETVFTRENNQWVAEDNSYIAPVSDTKLALYSPNGEYIYELRPDTNTVNKFVAYAKNEDGVDAPVKQSSLMIGSFTGGNNEDLMSVIGKLDLGVFLGVDDEQSARDEDNKLVVAISYGTYGEDYTFENGEVVPLNGKQFTKLKDLMSDSSNVLNNVQLGSILGITTREEIEDKDNAMLVALAYGTYGKDFDYKADGTVVAIGDKTFTTLGDLLNNPNDTIRSVQVGPMLGIMTKEDVEENDSLLVALSYGKLGEDFTYDESGRIQPVVGGKPFTTVAELTDSEQSSQILESIPLSSVFGVDIFDENADPLILSLAYGSKGKHYNIVEENGKKAIDWLTNPDTGEPYQERTFGALRGGDMSEIINDVRLCDILSVEEGGLISTLVGKTDQNGNPWTVAHLTDENIQSLKLGEVMEIKADSHPLLIYMQDQPIKDLDNDYIDGITVKDALGIDETEDPILGAIMDLGLGQLKDSSVLKDKINGLYVSDLIDDAESNFYLKHVSDSTIGNLPEAISELTVMQLFEDSIDKDADGNPIKTWYYLLTYNPDPEHTYDPSNPTKPNVYPYTAPDAYKVTDMSKLIENMHNNIEKASLNQLHDDGLIPNLGDKGDGTNTLDQDLLPDGLTAHADAIRDILGLSADQDLSNMTIGDLTVLQASDYLGYLLSEVLG